MACSTRGPAKVEPKSLPRVARWPWRSAATAPNIATTRPRCCTSDAALSTPGPLKGRIAISTSGISTIRPSAAAETQASTSLKKEGRRFSAATAIGLQMQKDLIEGVGRHHLAADARVEALGQVGPFLELLGR